MTAQFETTSRPGGVEPSWGPPEATTAVQEPVVPDATGTGTPAPDSGESKEPLGRRLWRGRPDDNRWIRPGFLLTLLLIGGLYTWNLTASGYANSFYSAA